MRQRETSDESLRASRGPPATLSPVPNQSPSSHSDAVRQAEGGARARERERESLLLVEALMGPVGAIHGELAWLVAVGLVHGILTRVGRLIDERRTSCWLEMTP